MNYDVDVPLFLPLYSDSRLRDLRLIAAKEQKIGMKIDGQNVFESGWEWTYWQQNVISARASFNP